MWVAIAVIFVAAFLAPLLGEWIDHLRWKDIRRHDEEMARIEAMSPDEEADADAEEPR